MISLSRQPLAPPNAPTATAKQPPTGPPTATAKQPPATHLWQLHRVGPQGLAEVGRDTAVCGVVAEADVEGLVLQQCDGLLAGEGAAHHKQRQQARHTHTQTRRKQSSGRRIPLHTHTGNGWGLDLFGASCNRKQARTLTWPLPPRPAYRDTPAQHIRGLQRCARLPPPPPHLFAANMTSVFGSPSLFS